MFGVTSLSALMPRFLFEDQTIQTVQLAVPYLRRNLPPRKEHEATLDLLEAMNAQIQWFVQGNFTVAVLTTASRMVVGVAKMNPTDWEDEALGRRIAAGRAYKAFTRDLM